MKRSDFLRVLGLSGLAAKLLPAPGGASPSPSPSPSDSPSPKLFPRCKRCGQFMGEGPCCADMVTRGPLEIEIRWQLHAYWARTARDAEVFWASTETVLALSGEVMSFGPAVVGTPYGGMQCFRYAGVDWIPANKLANGEFRVGMRCEECGGRGMVARRNGDGLIPEFGTGEYSYHPCPALGCEAPRPFFGAADPNY